MLLYVWGGIEDLKHFILDCDALNRIREKLTRLQRPRLEDWTRTLGEFLYGVEKKKSRKDLIELWKERQRRRRLWEAEEKDRAPDAK